MLAEGHWQAQTYGIGQVWEENALVVDRIKKRLSDESTMMRAVVNAGIAAFGKKGREADAALIKLIEGLRGDGE